MIDYLQHGSLPNDNKTVRRVLLTKDYFAIRDGKLIHLGVKRQKNNSTDQPIAEQICITKAVTANLVGPIPCATNALWIRKDVPNNETKSLLGQHVYGRAKLRGQLRNVSHR